MKPTCDRITFLPGSIPSGTFSLRLHVTSPSKYSRNLMPGNASSCFWIGSFEAVQPPWGSRPSRPKRSNSVAFGPSAGAFSAWA